MLPAQVEERQTSLSFADFFFLFLKEFNEYAN